MEQILFRAMGSEIFCALDGNHPRAPERLKRVPAMFEAWERVLSRFRANSELTQLNARAGQTVRVSETLWRVLEQARRAQEMSGGLVAPTLLGALEAAGYAQTFEQLRAMPILQGGRERPAQLGVWQLDDARHGVILSAGTRLGLGGIAKGWAAEQAAVYLGELGPALVDAGGDMVMTTPRADGTPWYIGIENPFAREHDDERLPILAIPSGAIATSGRDFRTWTRDGKRMHHIIDPRTGLPAATDVMTATVIAPTISDAETAAKVALILGSGEGMRWIEERPHLAAVLILDDETVLTSTRLERFVT